MRAIIVAFSTLSWACGRSSAFRFSRPAIITGPTYYCYSKNPLLLQLQLQRCNYNCVRLFAAGRGTMTKDNDNDNNVDYDGIDNDNEPILFSLTLLPVEQQNSFLIQKAKEFISHKNAAGCGDNNLEPVFDMIPSLSLSCSGSGSSNNKNNNNNANNNASNNYNANIYGLTGEDIRPGLEKFFEEYQGLQHKLIAEPICVGSGPTTTYYTVQYPFEKSWRKLLAVEDNNNNSNNNNKWEDKLWSSIDPTKPRNKVERLCFDDQGMLVRVAVVEATTPVAPLFPVEPTQ